jgi:glycosyltransferase involved in cell wall biosynthesis
MRIALSVNTSWNVVNFRAGLVRALTAAGHRVIVLTPTDAYTPRLKDLGCRHVPLPMDNKGTSVRADAALLARYRHQLAELKPDVFLGFTIKPNVYGSLAARSLGIPTINNISGLGTAFLSGGVLRRVAEFLYRRGLSHSARVFFQNEDDRNLFVERGLVPAYRTALLPGSGINLAHFAAVPLPERAAGEPFQFLFVGRVLRDKGVGELVDAMRILRASGSNARCAIVGSMDVENRTAIARSQMQEWVDDGLVNYLGPTNDVRGALAAADCVVLPSYREGTPRTLLEAAATGRPLIATNVPGCREVVRHGFNGLLCPVRDAAGLAEAMAAMMAMPQERRATLAAAGRRLVEVEFDESIVINRYLEAIDAAVVKPTWIRRAS